MHTEQEVQFAVSKNPIWWLAEKIGGVLVAKEFERQYDAFREGGLRGWGQYINETWNKNGGFVGGDTPYGNLDYWLDHQEEMERYGDGPPDDFEGEIIPEPPDDFEGEIIPEPPDDFEGEIIPDDGPPDDFEGEIIPEDDSPDDLEGDTSVPGGSGAAPSGGSGGPPGPSDDDDDEPTAVA